MIKIAIPTDDKTQISEYTGRATFFAIASIEDENITHLEFRNNPLHEHGSGGEHSHTKTVAAIGDCDVIMVRKIATYLRDELQVQKKKIVITSSNSIGEGIKRYLGASI